jgi:hypothetical protein
LLSSGVFTQPRPEEVIRVPMLTAYGVRQPIVIIAIDSRAYGPPGFDRHNSLLRRKLLLTIFVRDE